MLHTQRTRLAEQEEAWMTDSCPSRPIPLPSQKVHENTTRIHFQVGSTTIRARKLFAPTLHPRNSLIVSGHMVCPTCLGAQILHGDLCDECNGFGFWDLAQIDHQNFQRACDLWADEAMRHA